MPSASTDSLDGRLYRAALALCPAGFRRDHGDEMAHDFEDARREAADSGGSLWLLRACMGADLVRTVIVQWFRTGLPFIAAASVVFSLAIAEGLATAARAASIRMPDGVEHEDTVVVLFMAEISIVLITMTILLSLWVGRLTERRRR